jgi:hypothetical protein
MIKTGEVSTRAVRRVRSQGLTISESPDSSMPVLPEDITAISPEEVMQLFSEVCSWLDYVEVQYAAAQIDHKAEDQKLEETEAKEQIKHRSEKHVSVMKAFTYDNPQVEAQRREALMAYAHEKMLGTVYNSLERKKFLLSRELTRRSYGD